MQSDHICGLYYVTHPSRWETKRHYLAQTKLTSHTTLTPVCYRTNLQQVFSNSRTNLINELRYTFPLYDGVSVGAYTIQYGKKTLKGVVKQKDDAKKTYQAAVDRGETAGLLENLPAGVFSVTIGNVPPKTDVHVSIDYQGELKHDAAIDGLLFTLPTSIAPRYGNYPGEALPPKATTAEGIAVTIDIDTATSAIRKVQSPSHPIAVSMGALSSDSSTADFQPSKASATLTQGSTELGADFVLQLLIDDISKPQALLEHHPTLQSRAIMTTLVPKFDLPLASPEIVFLADQSGSMSGSKNADLVAALSIFLKSLPHGVRFNICAFGSRYDFLWPSSQPYTEANLNHALACVRGFNASHGGTEIYAPLQAAFERHLKDLPLEIMMLTDGEIWGEANVFGLINQHVQRDKVDARVFALGIGHDVSHTLVEGVARAGNGFAQFVSASEQTDQKVMRMLRAALYPHIKDYSIHVNYDDSSVEEVTEDFEMVDTADEHIENVDTASSTEASKPTAPTAPASFYNDQANLDKPIATNDRYGHLPKVPVPNLLQAPIPLPPLYPFNRTYAYLILDSETPQKKVTSVTVKATAPNNMPLELTVPVYHTPTPANTIHQLAARKAMQDLEEGRGWLHAAKTTQGKSISKAHPSRFDELVEREAVRLGERFQVAGKWCSFVAVDEHSEAIKSDRQTVFQPALDHGIASASPASFTSATRSCLSVMPPPPPGASSFSSQLKQLGNQMSQQIHDQQFHISKMQKSQRNQPAPSSLMSVRGGAHTQKPQVAMMQMSQQNQQVSSSLMMGGAPTQQAQSYSLFGRAAPAPSVGLFDAEADEDCDEEEGTVDHSEDEDMGFALMDDGDYEEQASEEMAAAPKKKRIAALQHPGAAPAAPAAPVAPANSTSTLYKIIDLQTFGGAWKWSGSLLALLGIKPDTVDYVAATDLNATALVLAVLKRNFAAQKDVWSLVADKAEAWMGTYKKAEADEAVKIAEAAVAAS